MRMTTRLARAAVVAIALLHGLPGAASARLVAIGDIHGAYEPLTQMLGAAGLVDHQLAWSGGDTTLVQLGDFTDRGPRVRAVFDLLMRLQDEAAAAGGRVVVLLGNHEAMNLLGVTRDATPAIYAKFADAGSRKRVDAAWADYQKLRDGLVSKGQAVPGALGATRDAFERAHPPGYIEYREALGPRGIYGKWLRDKPMVTALGSTIFIHAGIPPASVPDMLDDLNKQLRDDVKRMDRFVQRLVEKRLALPFFTLEEVVDVATAQIAGANEAITRATDRGDRRALSQLDLPFLNEAEDIAMVNKWLGLDGDGAMWWRGLAEDPDDPTGGPLLPVLERFKAVRFVVGHTPSATKRIVVRYGGRAVLIDTGMNRRAYNGNPAALEIVGGRLTAIYLDRREELTP